MIKMAEAEIFLPKEKTPAERQRDIIDECYTLLGKLVVADAYSKDCLQRSRNYLGKGRRTAAASMLEIVHRRLQFRVGRRRFTSENIKSRNLGYVYTLAQGLIGVIRANNAPDIFSDFVRDVQKENIFETEAQKDASFYGSARMRHNTTFAAAFAGAAMIICGMPSRSVPTNRVLVTIGSMLFIAGVTPLAKEEFFPKKPSAKNKSYGSRSPGR